MFKVYTDLSPGFDDVVYFVLPDKDSDQKHMDHWISINGKGFTNEQDAIKAKDLLNQFYYSKSTMELG